MDPNPAGEESAEGLAAAVAATSLHQDEAHPTPKGSAELQGWQSFRLSRLIWGVRSVHGSESGVTATGINPGAQPPKPQEPRVPPCSPLR